MTLFNELINKKLEFYMELQNTKHYLISVWNLHIIYLICCNLSGYIDSKINYKNKLFSMMFSKIYKGEYSDAEKIINELNNLSHEEIKVINDAINKLEAKKELLNELGDINPERYKNYGFVAVSTWDSM